VEECTAAGMLCVNYSDVRRRPAETAPQPRVQKRQKAARNVDAPGTLADGARPIGIERIVRTRHGTVDEKKPKARQRRDMFMR